MSEVIDSPEAPAETASQVLTPEKIRAADDRPRVRVEVPEWGGHVFVQTMTGEDISSYEQTVVEGPGGMERHMAVVVVHSAVDEKGDCIFGIADIPWLNQKSGAALKRIFNVSVKLNRLLERDIEELEKNCESSRGSSSDTGSR